MVYPVTTQTPEGAFTTVIAFYVCEDMGLDIVLGQDYTEHCSAASGAFSVFKLPVLFSRTHPVVHPFICTLYHIHNDVINHLNNVILLTRENLRQVPCQGSDIDFDQRRKTRIPRDYQGTSTCTLEAAAVQCSLAELPRGPLLMKDILLRKMHSGVRATVFTHDAVQLHAILKMHGFHMFPTPFANVR